jgi:hypothetical protein
MFLMGKIADALGLEAGEEMVRTMRLEVRPG